MECVKLEMNYDDGMKKTRKCQRFSGKEGIEGLLFVEDRFWSVTTQLNFNQGTEFFNNWLEVLVDIAEDKWIIQVRRIAVVDCMIARFDLEMKKFYRKYCDAEVNDTVFGCLATLCRPTKVTPQDHCD
eukprot:14043997-Ditylum_brightwellii.AAC.1